MDIKVGEKIRLRAFNDEIIERVLVRDCGQIIEITMEDEFMRARSERREPIVVGFRKESIVEKIGKSGIYNSV